MHSLVVHDDVLLGLPDRDVLLVRTLWQGQIEGLLVRTLWQRQIEGLLVCTLWQRQIEGLLARIGRDGKSRSCAC